MISFRTGRLSVCTLMAGVLFAASAAAAQSDRALENAFGEAATAAAVEAASVDRSEDVSHPGAPRTSEPAAAAAQAASTADNPLLKFFAGTELTGFVDTYYSYNFNTPKTPCSSLAGVLIFNCLHAFDVAHNSFSLNLAELALEKKPTADSRAGYRIDLDYGAGATLTAAYEPGGATPIYQTVQQAYISFLAPVGKGLQVDVGKFVTPAGFEVIESKDNWNYSRGLLFTLGMPLYHQGLRVSYPLSDKTSVSGFLVNGWNNSVDDNGAKTIGAQFVVKPTSSMAFTANYIGGPEIPLDNTDWRHLLDIVGTYTVNPKISVALNYDFGKELSTKWQGLALYLKYQPTAWFSLSPRYEAFDDRDGWALIGQAVQEFTLTSEFKHKDGVLMRVEYRGDRTRDPFFLKNVSDLVKAQNVLTISWVYAFSSKMH